MYEWSRDRLHTEGFEHYEVSNWARQGRQCRHNLAYWHNETWLGLGAGAHSHLNDERFSDVANPRRYAELVNETWKAARPNQQPAMKQVTFREPPDRAREMAETVILALRLREGLHVPTWEKRFGVSLESVYADAVRETLELGLTERIGDTLRLRDEAVMLGDEAFLRFLPEETLSD
jgi:oxygen-independent coproporphyrinogen-3 oxidase